MFVNHVQALEPPPTSGDIELEVHTLHLMRIRALVTPHLAFNLPRQLLLAKSGVLQTLFLL